MTDSPTPADPGPVDPDAELASADLDGEAGAEERARVDEPSVRGHRAAFAAVAEEVREVPPPAPGLVDDHVSRAMDAFDGEARVVPLGGRASTQPWWQRIPVGAVAAALVIVALIGAIGLASTADDDDADTAATALDAGDEGAGGTDEAVAEDGDASAGAAMEDSTALESQEQFEASGERTAYDSYDALAEDLRTQLSDAGATAAESDPTTTQAERSPDDDEREGASDPCDAVSLLGLDPADVVLVLPAVVTADEVTVVVHDADDGRRLTVVDDATCAVALDRLL